MDDAGNDGQGWLEPALVGWYRKERKGVLRG